MTGLDYVVRERRVSAIYSEIQSILTSLERDIRGHPKIVQLIQSLEGSRLGDYVFRLRRFDCEATENPDRYAYVQTIERNKVLFVDDLLWSGASLGEPSDVYVLCHEVGHLLLHAGEEKNFTKIEDLESKYPNEVRAEWQAHEVARQLYMPYSSYVSSLSIDEICRKTGLPASTAIEIRKGSRQLFPTPYAGESCPKCSNFTVVRVGNGLKCDSCGSTCGR